MKRILAYTFLGIVLVLICFLGFSIYNQLQEKHVVKERTAELPEFSVTTT